MNVVAVWFFKLLAYLPLSVLHRLGVFLGWLTYRFSASYAARLKENLRAGLAFLKPQAMPAEFEAMRRANVAEVGKSILELPWVWQRPLDEVVASVRQCHGWEHIATPQANGKSVIILTPHFGCFELVALYTAARYPMTSMYKSPRWQFLDALMHQGRERGKMKLAPADLGGVRQLLKALKRGEIIGVLPDQVPSNGEGEWVNFFGRPAYTMTLIGRLMQASGASVVMCQMQRLPRGEGYTLHCTPLSFDDSHSISAQVNVALENAIRACPEQYLWSYNRYKTPRGVNSPNNSKESTC